MTVCTWLLEIPPDECESLLANSETGRLGVVLDGHSEIFPVNHVYDRRSGCIAFPTNDHTKLDAALHWPSVAFEVDGIEPDRSAGWSVAVVGRAELLTDAEEIARLAEQRRVIWMSGATARWVRIVPTKLTGMRISGAQHPDDSARDAR